MKHFREIVSFLLLTSVIFVWIFTIMNFPAIKEIASPYIFAEEVQKKEIILKKTVNVIKKEQKLFVPKWAKKLVKKEYPTFTASISPIDSRIIIPKLWVNAPIMEMWKSALAFSNWKEFENSVQWELKNWVVHYPWTARAWEIWNMFVTGHSSYYPWDDWNYKDIFARLHKLEVWDEYYIYQNQKKYTYKITTKKEVNPKNVSVLSQPKNKRISTLMTCTPVWTSLRRLIITSELL